MTYYVNPASTIAVAVIFPVLGAILLVARYASRRRTTSGLGLDDLFSLLSFLFVLGCAIVLIVGVANKSIGYHNQDLSATTNISFQNEAEIHQSQEKYAFYAISVAAIGFIRLSLLFLFRHVFRVTSIHVVIWVFIILVIVWTVVFLVANLAICGANSWAFWSSPAIWKARCANTFDVLAATSISDFIIDLGVLFLPLHPLWHLQMKLSKKIGVSFVFLLGIFSVAASLTRMILSIELMDYKYGSTDPLFGLAGTRDRLGVVSTYLWWGMIEIGVATITCNLPVLTGFIWREWIQSPFNSLTAWISLRSLRTGRSRGSGSAGSGEEEAQVRRQRQRLGEGEGVQRGADMIDLEARRNWTLAREPFGAPTYAASVVGMPSRRAGSSAGDGSHGGANTHGLSRNQSGSQHTSDLDGSVSPDEIKVETWIETTTEMR